MREGDIDPLSPSDYYSGYKFPDFKIIESRDWPQPWKRLTRIYANYLGARQVSANIPYDLILGREPYSLLLLANKGIPIIFESHQMPGFFEGMAQRLLFQHKSFSRLITVSEILKQDYLAEYPSLSEENIVVAPCGVNARKLDIPSETVDIQVSQNRLSVGYIGALYSGKGMEIVSELAILAPDVDFYVVGGRESDIDFWRSKDVSNIVFLGQQPNNRIGSYLNRFDVVLLPSQAEIKSFEGKGNYGRWTSPMKMFEYMGYGKAIISSDLPVLKEILDDEETALIAKADDPNDWLRQLKRLQNSPEFRVKLENNARAKCLAEYTRDVIAVRTLKGL